MRAGSRAFAVALLVAVPGLALTVRGTAGPAARPAWSGATVPVAPAPVASSGSALATRPGRGVADTGFVRLRLAAAGNEARYIVNEQLAGRPLRNDAVGATNAVTGQVLLDRGGKFVADSSVLTVDLSTLKTDQARRDNFVRQRTLQVTQYPTAELRPRELRGLAWPLPGSGEHVFQLAGDLTLHGVTRPSVWAVTARFAGDRITGTARTHFKFADYGLEIPRLAFVLSVQDSIRLEYDFSLER